MSESYESTAILNALSGTTDSNTGANYPTIAESPYYTNIYKALRQINKILAGTVSELRPYVDDSATHTIGVMGGKIPQADGDIVAFTGTTLALTNGSTNYVYIYDASGTWTLAKSTVGYPGQGATPHIPIATVDLSDSPTALAQEDITDDRGDVLFYPPGQTLTADRVLCYENEVLCYENEILTI